jgi:hypothetical protein
MKYRTLPGTGVSVSNLALGTMGFGTETDEPDAFWANRLREGQEISVLGAKRVTAGPGVLPARRNERDQRPGASRRTRRAPC